MDVHPGPSCNETRKGRDATPGCPGLATLVSDLSSPLPNIAHGTHLPSPGAKAARGRLPAGRGVSEPLSRGHPTASPRQHCPYCSHSQILIPGLAPCPPDLGGPRAAPLGRVSRQTRDDVNSVQPCFYTALLGKPSDHIAELLARPARLPAPWARAPIASAPKQWAVVGALS